MVQTDRRPLWAASVALFMACSASDTPGVSPCHYEEQGCSPDADPAVWDDLARDRGFPIDPGGNFFGYAQSGCQWDLAQPPETVVELGQRSQHALFARVVDVTVRVRSEATTDLTEYLVYLVLNVERSVKGDASGTILVSEPCSHGAKVAGLRNTIPDDMFLFFLVDPLPSEVGAEHLYLAWYEFGVVREGPAGPEFAYKSSQTDGLLDGYETLGDIADVARLD